MSPSESDLRAALRHGEGDDAVDVEHVLTHARTARAQRRTRVLSTAAAVVVVAGAAAGGAVLWGGSDGRHQQAGKSSSSLSSTPVRSAVAGPNASDDAKPATSCPGTYPSRTTPPAGSSPSSTAAMFAEPVRIVIVCGYSTLGGQGESAVSAAVRLTGTDATGLTDSIEQASKTKLSILCPDIRSAQRSRLAIVAFTADGHALPTVTTDVSIPNCNQPITNGTAVRWAWKPPADLAGRINALTGPTRHYPVGGLTGGNGVTSGVRNGTPVR